MTKPRLADIALWSPDYRTSEDDARMYRDPRDGKRYPSVTSVLKLVDKSGLSQWAVNLALEWAVENWAFLGQRSNEEAIRAGKYRWKDFRDERAGVGDGVHAAIEAEHLMSWDVPELNDEQKRIMDQWRLLNEKHEIVPILSEFTVFDTDLGYAGTADGYWMIDGVPTLVDIKTSRKTWEDHFFQLAALWHAPDWLLETEEMVWTPEPSRDMEACALIHLREDSHEIVWAEMDKMPYYWGVFEAYAKVWYARDALRLAGK